MLDGLNAFDAMHTRAARLDRAMLIDLASRLGLDPRRVALRDLQHAPDALDDNLARLRPLPSPAARRAGQRRAPLERQLSAYDYNALEADYRTALDRAQDLVDRGADPATLADAFEQ